MEISQMGELWGNVAKFWNLRETASIFFTNMSRPMKDEKKIWNSFPTGRDPFKFDPHAVPTK